MRKNAIALVVVAGLAVAAAVVGAGGACKSDACTKDTDCELPLICVHSACVLPGGGAAAEPDADVPPPDGDVPPPDGDADVEDGAPDETGGDADAEVEVDEDGDGEGDGETEGLEGDEGTEGEVGPCTPTLSAARQLATTAADGEERPAVTAATDRFIAVARTPNVEHTADALHVYEVNRDGMSTSNRTVLGGVQLDPEHPVTRISDTAVAMAFGVPEGPLPGLWVKIVLFGTDSPLPQQIPGTDANSTQPTITYSGTNLVIAWAQSTGGGASVEIRAQRFSAVDGTPSGDAVTLATAPAGTKEPRLQWGDWRHALAYFDASDGALHVLTLDGTLAELAEHVLTPPAGHTFVGYPSLAWNGRIFGLAWETRGAAESSIHLATFLPGEAPAVVDPLTGTVALMASEEGQVALAWGEGANEWGIAWRRSEASRVGVALVRVDATDSHVIEGPVDLSVAATTALHPALAYQSGYYIAAWIEQGAGAWPVYEVTRGCTP